MKVAEMPEEYFVGQALVWPENEVDEVLAPVYRGFEGAFDIARPIYARVSKKDELTKKQYLDMNMWLPGDILLKADKMCMAHSLELRVPFLDRNVMEFAQHIPSRYRVNSKGNKQVLRHAANKVLPDEWATRPKVGFPVPMVNWLREDVWYDFVEKYFTADWAKEFFDTDVLMGLLKEHYHGDADNQRKIYTPLVFLIWYERFFILEEKEKKLN
ncbi:MAG: asparagine synthase C-terminal domain-containing protein [Eggerthellaceae bacterium]|nr:asparagine synthase C-terminal domain-containing protein [Eggerthellaceae bacterium]